MFKENSFFHILSCGENDFKSSNDKKINYWLNENKYLGTDDRYRIWHVKKGTGKIKTIYGDIQLKENKVYFFPIHTIMSASYSDFLSHQYIDFLPNNEFFSFFNTKPYVSNNYLMINTLFDYIKENYEKDKELTNFYCSSMLSSILSCFFNDTKNYMNDGTFITIKTYIDSHFCDKNISIQMLAKKFNFSVQHFERIFKKNQNISPKIYIINKRIIKAQTLLKFTSKSIKTISKECGFEDQLYFSKIFKKINGESPLIFRRHST